MKRAIALLVLCVSTSVFAQNVMPIPLQPMPGAQPLPDGPMKYHPAPPGFDLILDEHGKPALLRRTHAENRKVWISGLMLATLAPLGTMLTTGFSHQDASVIGVSAVPFIGAVVAGTLDQNTSHIPGYVVSSLISGAGIAMLIVGFHAGPLKVDRLPLNFGLAPLQGGGAFSASGHF